MRTEVRRAEHDTCDFVSNPLISTKEGIERESTHAVTEQEQRNITPCLFNQCDNLVVELLNCQATNPVTSSVAKAFVVNEVHAEAVQSKLQSSFEENIMALCCSMRHSNRSFLLDLGDVNNFSAVSVHSITARRVVHIIPPESKSICKSEITFLECLNHIQVHLHVVDVI